MVWIAYLPIMADGYNGVVVVFVLYDTNFVRTFHEILADTLTVLEVKHYIWRFEGRSIDRYNLFKADGTILRDNERLCDQGATAGSYVYAKPHVP